MYAVQLQYTTGSTQMNSNPNLHSEIPCGERRTNHPSSSFAHVSVVWVDYRARTILHSLRTEDSSHVLDLDPQHQHISTLKSVRSSHDEDLCFSCFGYRQCLRRLRSRSQDTRTILLCPIPCPWTRMPTQSSLGGRLCFPSLRPQRQRIIRHESSCPSCITCWRRSCLCLAHFLPPLFSPSSTFLRDCWCGVLPSCGISLHPLVFQTPSHYRIPHGSRVPDTAIANIRTSVWMVFASMSPEPSRFWRLFERDRKDLRSPISPATPRQRKPPAQLFLLLFVAAPHLHKIIATAKFVLVK